LSGGMNLLTQKEINFSNMLLVRDLYLRSLKITLVTLFIFLNVVLKAVMNAVLNSSFTEKVSEKV
jgi:hypothetical protein